MVFMPVSSRAVLHRSALSVPGAQLRFFDKAVRSEADVVILDLEDSVAFEDKEKARRNVIEAINDYDWGHRIVSVRINALDTPWMHRDLLEIVEKAGDRLDLLLLPKVNCAADVYVADTLISQLEMARNRPYDLGFELLVETAAGLENVQEIARASQRNRSLHFGVADYAASTGARTVKVGGPNPDYFTLAPPSAALGAERPRHWNDMWHYALARIGVSAHAAGLRPIDGPFGDIADGEGYRAECTRAAALGCAGKWVIHPSQIAIANDVFSPTEDEIASARKILSALDQSEAEAKGAILFEGRMIGLASIRQAEVVVRKADIIAARQAGTDLKK